MNDRELLTKAAKAAGYTLDADCDRTDVRDNGGGPLRWNPLTDDGDALRLAVKLKLSVGSDGQSFQPCVMCWRRHYVVPHVAEPEGSDPFAATRRAIVRAAAEMADAPGAA